MPRIPSPILIYGLLGGVLIAALKLIEYRFLVLEHAIEIYGGLIALVFAALGIWLGLKLTKTREVILVKEVPVPVPVVPSLILPLSGISISPLSLDMNDSI